MNYTIQLPPSLYSIYQIFNAASYELFVVGGYVRNSILDRGATDFSDIDIDLTTNATPKQMTTLFKNRIQYKVIPTGIKHGTITLLYQFSEEGRKSTECNSSIQFEITTFRSDGTYKNKRHPEQVTFSDNLSDDLSRRDFTINALVYDIENNKIIDQFDGLSDLKNKLIRCIGNPTVRFQEDALRMMRACRFAAQLNFELDQDTFTALKDNANDINQISKERIHDEFIKLVISGHPTKGMELLRTSGLMTCILPELTKTIGVKQNRFHSFSVYEHSIKALENLNKVLTLPNRSFKKLSTNTDLTIQSHQLALATLFHDLGKPATLGVHPETGEPTFYNHENIGVDLVEGLLKRLKFSGNDIKIITHLVRHHMLQYSDDWKPATIRRYIKKVGRDYLEVLFVLIRSDRLAKHPFTENSLAKLEEECADLRSLEGRIEEVLESESYFTIDSLKISGNLLMAKFNIEPGPIIGEILRCLLERVIDDPSLNQEDSLIDLASEYLANKRKQDSSKC